MQSVIENLARLAKTISQDRNVHIYSKDVLLDAHVVGFGFINDPKKGSDEANMDEEEPTDGEPSLFVDNDHNSDIVAKEDSVYIDEGIQEDEDLEWDDDAKVAGCEEALKWLNSLGDQIVSGFSKDAVHSFPTSLLTW
jgi:hypothetical protein